MSLLNSHCLLNMSQTEESPLFICHVQLSDFSNFLVSSNQKLN